MHDDEALTFSENIAFSSHNVECRSESMPSHLRCVWLMPALTPQMARPRGWLHEPEIFLLEFFFFKQTNERTKPLMEFKIYFSLLQSFVFHLSRRIQSFHMTFAYVLDPSSRSLEAIHLLLEPLGP